MITFLNTPFYFLELCRFICNAFSTVHFFIFFQAFNLPKAINFSISDIIISPLTTNQKQISKLIVLGTTSDRNS